MANHPHALPADPPPLAPGFLSTLRFDALAGFLVFLIAMPLCLAIARASGYPPIAGIWTAVIGGLLCTFLSDSELTIKGPAAGLIVIVYCAVTELGAEFGGELLDVDQAMLGYRLTLGIGVTAGVVQILMGLLRAGRLVDLFPLTPVHGMLAAIGIIIIVKQFYEVIGATPETGAGIITLMQNLPSAVEQMNPKIAIIGGVGLVLLFGMPWLPFRSLKCVPAQMVVLVVAIGLSTVFSIHREHHYLFLDSLFSTENYNEYVIGPRFLVDMPNILNNPGDAFVFPRFDAIASVTGIKYIVLFSVIGSLESLLSAKAVELLDPWQRKTNFDREQLAIGVANTVASAVGALPMISEIVRSKANIDNGARTRVANFVHGACLLGFVLLFPGLIHRIPLAALAAMLVYTGFRLASPHEFVRAYRIGSDQFIVFLGTIIATLTTDLLFGMAIGIVLELVFHLWHGSPIAGMLKSAVVAVPEGDILVVLVVKRSAVFSNWLSLKNAIQTQAEGRDTVVLDLSHTRFVDHSVMEKLHEVKMKFAAEGKHFSVIGLHDHTPLSSHPHAARKMNPLKRSHRDDCEKCNKHETSASDNVLTG